MMGNHLFTKFIKVLMLLLIFNFCWFFSQALVVMVKVSSIGRVFGDSCKYRVRVTTRASGPSNELITAYATMF